MKIFKLFLFIISINSILISGEITWDINHDTSQLSTTKYNGYDLIILDNGRIHIPAGSPALPSIVLRLSIPNTSRVISVTFENDLWIDVGNYDIMPAQPATPLSMDPIFVSENQEIYSKNKYYPENPVLSFNTGNKSGFIIAGIDYCPLRYNPVTHKLQLLQSGRLLIKYQEGLEDMVYLTQGQIDIYSSDMMGMVSNPQNVFINSPLVKEGKDPLTEYVIITPTDLVTSFEPLIQWKRQKGISSMVVSDAWIYANYSGRDNMEKIREFVKDYHQNHGLIYFIMAGDFDNLGARIVPISGWVGMHDETPSDLYFSDVVPYNSDWDANNNDSFGEFEVDSCDFYSDVYVGRFPLNTPEEVIRWVNKVLTYEKNPPTGFIEKSLMVGAIIYHDSTLYLSGKDVCDSIADNHLPQWWNHVKLYEDTINPPPLGVSDSISRGFGWCHFAAHGDPNGSIIYWYVGGSIISVGHNPTNGMKLGVMHATSCNAGRFDGFECLGEHYFNAPQGGSIAVIFNARGGFGDENPPYIGPSGWLNIWTADECFIQENWNIGVAHGIGKDHIIVGMDIRDHHCLTELNLFGDPETQIYSREPSLLEVSHYPVIPIGPATFNVEVNSSGNPIAGAICCMSSPDDSTLWFKATTDNSGIAQIAYDNLTQDNLILTVYAHDYRFYQDTIFVSNQSSYVVFLKIDSLSGGYNNNQINGGCSYDVLVAVLNFGSNSLTDVKGVLTSTAPYISLDPDTLLFGNISANDTAVSSNFAGFTISDGVTDSTIIPMELLCWDFNDSSWTSNFSFVVIAPELELQSIEGPVSVFPCDSFYLSPKLKNNASGVAYNVDIICRINDPYLVAHDSLEQLTKLDPDSLVKLDSAFYLSISPSCPQPYFADMEIIAQTSGGYGFIDTITIGIGSAFSDNFESGDTSWTYTGPTSWHITGHRYHQGSYSMYCGDEGSWQYSNTVINSRVETPSISLTRGGQITFWHWYQIYDNYDKVQIQISTDSGSNWELVTPVEGYTGIWGYSPNDSIYTGDHRIWEEQHVNLDITTDVNISWLFFSNSVNSAEGYYFDDVNVLLGSGFVGLEEENLNHNPLYVFSLKHAYPNPVCGRAVIQYSIGSEVPVKLIIYDISGREVITLVNQVQRSGNYRVEWNGRDNHGSIVSSGTYFYRMTAGSFSSGEKLVVIR